MVLAVAMEEAKGSDEKSRVKGQNVCLESRIFRDCPVGFWKVYASGAYIGVSSVQSSVWQRRCAMCGVVWCRNVKEPATLLLRR